MRDFIDAEFAAKGMIADWVYHDKPGNPHVHVMHTLRVIEAVKFGAKRIPLRDEAGAVRRHNGVPLYRPLIRHARGLQGTAAWPGAQWPPSISHWPDMALLLRRGRLRRSGLNCRPRSIADRR